MERRLCAIVAADAVGYSALMERDEQGTFDRLKAHRTELFEPEIEKHHGRIFKLMGDGLLAEFASVVDAVQCVVVLQQEMARRNAGVADDQRIDVRIGVNLGDVMIEGKDRHGEGVNIAARLQQLASRGGICVSQSVVDQLSNKLAVGFNSMGEHQVKNIAKPVLVYSVVLDGAVEARRSRTKLPWLRRWRWPTAIATAVAAALAVAWLEPWTARVEPAAIERMALPLPKKPSLAVLPFDNLGGDSEHGYLADGMTEDLITDLSKLSGIFVISRHSSWAYKGKPAKVQQVAEDLGVRYVLEGSVRREGDHVRINAQLVDALGGQQLWAERYDGSVRDVFAAQDKVIRQIVTALAVKLTSEEQVRFGQAETDKPEAYDAMLEGWDHYRRGTENDTHQAISLFEKAIELDPAYGRAYAALAAANWRIASSFWQSAIGAGFEHAYESMNNNLAKAMEKPTSLAYAVSAEVLTQQGRYDEAFAQISHAMALAPNDPDNYVAKAKILNASGRAAEADEAARWAMRLNPQYPPEYLRTLAIALFHQERYQEAIETLERVMKRQPDVNADYATLVSSYGHLGRRAGVDALIGKFNDLAVPAGYSPLTVQEVGYWYWYSDLFDYYPAYRERLLEGLRRAGVPEGAGTDIPYADYRQLISRSAGEYDVAGATKIEAGTAKALHDRGVVFVDVRAANGFSRGHVPGAVNLDLVVDLTADSLSRVVGRNDEVAFSCRGKYCQRSAYASAKALKWGFTHVYYFAGGFPAWQDAGYPVEVSAGQ